MFIRRLLEALIKNKNMRKFFLILLTIPLVFIIISYTVRETRDSVPQEFDDHKTQTNWWKLYSEICDRKNNKNKYLCNNLTLFHRSLSF